MPAKTTTTFEIEDYGSLEIHTGRFERGIQLDLQKIEPHPDGLVYISREEAESLSIVLSNAVSLANV